MGRTRTTTDVDIVTDLGCALGESPIWDPRTHQVVWVDILGGVLYTWAEAMEEPESLYVGRSLSAVAPGKGGGYVLATRDGFAALDASGKFGMIAAVEADVAGNRMNDGKCDDRGRFWAGTISERHISAAGALYMLDPVGNVTKVLGDITISNGLDWSPDGQTMYYVDSATHGLDAFDFEMSAGRLGHKHRVIDINPSLGSPDGITVDEEGFIWVALRSGGAVHRYSPQARLDLRVELPVPLVTSCTFGGPDLKDLYITTAASKDKPIAHEGALFRYPAPVAGIPCRSYGE